MNRLEKINSQLRVLKIDSFLVKSLPNIRYLSGFSGSAATILITKDKNYFITDFRYKSQCAKEVSSDFEIMIYVQNSMSFLEDLIKENDVKRMGFESNFMTYAEVENLKKDFKAEFVAVDSLVEKIVSIKNENEIEKTKKAVDITDKTFSESVKLSKPITGIAQR